MRVRRVPRASGAALAVGSGFTQAHWLTSLRLVTSRRRTSPPRRRGRAVLGGLQRSHGPRRYEDDGSPDPVRLADDRTRRRVASPCPSSGAASCWRFWRCRRSWVGRAELAAMLWPEQENKLAYTNLRKTLFRLQSLPWGGRSRCRAARCASKRRPTWPSSSRRCGTAASPRPCRCAAASSSPDSTTSSSEAWSSWLGLRARPPAAAWRSAALDAPCGRHRAGRGHRAVGAAARRRSARRSRAARAHVVARARAGRAARARQAYREFVGAPREDLGLAPGAELKALHDSLGTADARLAPASARRRRATPEDGFVGRTVELRRIGELLAQDDCRLLISLVGRAASARRGSPNAPLRELAPGYADGATFVPLEDMRVRRRARRPARARARCARWPAGTIRSIRSSAFLRDRQMLLVLDNFEQLAADASQFSRR